MKKILFFCVMALLLTGCEQNEPSNGKDPSSNTIGIGHFTVSESKQVTFSPGNLQYHPANNKWRFAPSQLDYVGKANENISSTYNGWLDLFEWSISSTQFGVTTSVDHDEHDGYLINLDRNSIVDNPSNTWRTLTHDEWKYLIFDRSNASSLRGVAQVNGVNGLILLPDNWKCPSDITFKSGTHNRYGATFYAVYQTFTADQWSKLEKLGAVFLPAAGIREGSSVNNVQNVGHYWSATNYENNNAYCLYFFSDGVENGYNNRDIGRSIRLIRDL